MIGVLTEVGKRVSGRWVTAMLLPGLVFVAVVTVALVLRHGQALDHGRLVGWAGRTGRGLIKDPARLVLVVVLVVAAAGVTGTTAAGLGRLIQRWFMRGWFLTGDRLVRSRFSRRSRALAAARRAGQPAVPAYLPQRPTWLGERVRLVEARVRAQYHLTASLLWPRLWLLLTEDARRPIADARTRYTEAVTLIGWGALYLLPGVLWWPALIIAGCVLLTAWRRARESLAEWTDLVEAAIDLRLRDLAEALGQPISGPAITAAEGRALDDRLGKAGSA
ncbi:hypothetical protein [Actinoplanes sp. NPDC089786]|uniref:hypothetical protein n=1 Tax=Actinoplanes sp. NPDC089786 TaxID=3155185 RepID=UPI0034202B86